MGAIFSKPQQFACSLPRRVGTLVAMSKSEYHAKVRGLAIDAIHRAAADSDLFDEANDLVGRSDMLFSRERCLEVLDASDHPMALLNLPNVPLKAATSLTEVLWMFAKAALLADVIACASPGGREPTWQL